MQVFEVMAPDVQVVNPEQSIREAARLMAERDIGALPVGQNDRLVGMVTDRDIVVRGVAQERVDAPVGEVMSEGMLYCREDDPVDAALESMRSQQVRRLPVVDQDKRLVGMLSLGDVATKAEGADTDEAVRGISEPSEPNRSSQSAASGTAGGGQTAR